MLKNMLKLMLVAIVTMIMGTGCSSFRAAYGSGVNQEKVDQMKVGKTTKSEVLAMGEPYQKTKDSASGGECLAYSKGMSFSGGGWKLCFDKNNTLSRVETTE